jgi:hypothetical protein
MGLSLHIAAGAADAPSMPPSLTLNETFHRQLFDRHLLRPGECPLLRRMSSPFEDASYSGPETSALASEALSLVARASPMLAKVLERIAKVADHAAAENRGIDVFAD